MRIIADISVMPLGVGVSLSAYIAECERVFVAMGLNPRLHAFGTNVEGEWDDVFKALQACHQAVHNLGVPRINTTIRFATRTDQHETIDDKVDSVSALVENSLAKGTSG